MDISAFLEGYGNNFHIARDNSEIRSFISIPFE